MLQGVGRKSHACKKFIFVHRSVGTDRVRGTFAHCVDTMRLILNDRRLLLRRARLRHCPFRRRLRLHLRGVRPAAGVLAPLGGGYDRPAVLAGHRRPNLLVLRGGTPVPRLRSTRQGFDITCRRLYL